MKYRRMGSLEWKVSALGFGAMRLPINKSWDDINYDEGIEMVRYAIDSGVNYVDTAWPYHVGNSETFLGKALQDGYREKVKLVTKCPIWLIKSSEDFDKYLELQLEKLQTSYLDFYLFHGINKDKWEQIKELDLLKKMEQAKAKGKIKHIGFSFHGSYDAFIEIIDSYSWDMTQIQFNYLDINYQATLKGLDYAYSKGIAVVIMEPLRGGKLALSNKEIDDIINSAPNKRSVVDWALQFVWNHPGVSVVLSGMSNLQQVKENVINANNSNPNSLTEDELRIIDELKEIYSSKIKVPCTNCQYCMPCEQGVDIPENFNLINHATWEGSVQEWLQDWYNEMDDESIDTDWHGKGKSSLCTQCGECLDKCPQKIDIPSELEDVKLVFEEGKLINRKL